MPPLWHDVYQGHLSSAGHRVVADALLRELRARSKIVDP
jgi:hypothetical protein